MKLIVISIIIIVTKSISQTIPTNSYLDQKNLYPDSNIIIKYQKDWQKDYFIKKIAEFNKKPLGDNKIVFLGNSITEGGHNWNKKFGVNNIEKAIKSAAEIYSHCINPADYLNNKISYHLDAEKVKGMALFLGKS